MISLRCLSRAAVATAAILLAACATVGPAEAPGKRYWDALGPGSEGSEVPAIEARLSQLFSAPLNESSCAEHRAALEHALNRIPIDLVGIRTARDCAALLADPEWQQRMQAQLDDLIDYAFRDGRGRSANSPAPILYPLDIEVLAESRGLEILWLRYVGLNAARHLLVEVSVREPVIGQRRYYFDLLDAMVRLNKGEPVAEYPNGRRLMAHARMENDALEGDALALTGHLYMNIETGEVSIERALRALSDAWESGVTGALVTWIELCLAGSPTDPGTEPACSDQDIEQAITTLKAEDIAEGWALEAAFRIARQGASVGDPGVEAALEAAAARSSEDRMRMYAAAVLIERDASADPTLDRSVGRLLQQAADAGNPEAHIQRVLRLPDEQRTADNPFVMRSLRAAEGEARAHMMLAVLLGSENREAVDHLIKAFDGDLPEAQLFLALSTDRAPLRDALFIRAAFGGNGAANLILAQQALMRDPDAPDREAALQWLASGALFGHTESAARLAALLWLHPELDPDSTDSGLDAVRQLDAEAGREIAMRVPEVLLDVAPYNSDPSEGVRLLKTLSAEGIGEATLMLAERYRYGQGVERDLHAASDAYLLAEQQGATEAAFDHADMAAYDLEQPERALQLFERAARAGHTDAASDLAWYLCTGTAGAAMDPLRGLSEVEALIARLDTPHPYYLSTLAACQAALGDFAHARSNHRVALQRALKELPEETEVHQRMRDRLELYEADRPYVWSP